MHFLSDPDKTANNPCYEYFSDGLLVINNGSVESLSDASQAISTLDPKIEVIEHKNSLILPGFVDTHIHYPQTEIIAAYGEQLLQWLNKYTFPAERKFEDKTYARNIADKFLNELC